MRIFVNSGEENLGPFSPTEAVAQLKWNNFTQDAPAQIEGQPGSCTVAEALRQAGLTPEGRELSTKLRRQGEERPWGESDAAVYAQQLPRRRRAGYSGTPHSEFAIIRRAGMLIPLILGFTLAIPWFTLGEGILPIKGYFVMMGLKAPFVVLLIVLAATTALIAMSNGAYLGGDDIDIATAISAVILAATLWMIPLAFINLLGIFSWRFGGGLQICTAALAFTAACSIVPLRKGKRGTDTDIAIITASLAAASGLFFLIQGVIFLLR